MTTHRVRQAAAALLLWLSAGVAAAQQTLNFEAPQLPADLSCTEGSSLSLSSARYKDGKQSLQWRYSAGNSLLIALPPQHITRTIWNQGGLNMWIYHSRSESASTKNAASRTSEHPSETPGESAAPCLRIEMLDTEGRVLGGFDYHLQASGWRACRMSFRRMRELAAAPAPSSRSGQANPPSALPVACRITAAHAGGTLWLDRVILPEPKADPRTTPDAQTPDNALVEPLQLGHWSMLQPWHQLRWDLPLRRPDARARRHMSDIEARLDAAMSLPQLSAVDRERLAGLWERFGIAPSPAGSGYCGAPLLCADECFNAAGEVSWRELDELMNLLARAAHGGDADARQRYLLLWEYALDQGFASGSCMGTNHHYGYATRNIFRSAWLLRETIAGHAAGRRIRDALTYWSGLPEVRQRPAADRADRCDSWNTLLLPRLMVAMMEPKPDERERNLRGLARWLNASLETTPGTMGGIKADGTTFHHSGFYPAYANDGLSAVGQYAEICGGTPYGLDEGGRTQLRRALETLRNCCNLRDWPLGISGRHPFRFGMTDGCAQAFARLAALEKGSAARSLARDYERLSATEPAAAPRRGAREQTPRSPRAPESFFAYNHAAAGVYRSGEALALMKGFNQDVWGSEIYTRDNRYGRYQSYGSVCILSSGRPVSQAAGGFSEPGWDWNRIPGATTIHLPLEELESPRSSTLMAYNPQSFAGAGSLEGRAGLFALHLQEADEKRFTPDFTARKSVFCCGGRLLCLGSAIRNGNSRYPTETTLFQCARSACTDDTPAPEGWLADGTGNYFRVLEGELKEASGLQQSRHNKTKRRTQGEFRTAWLDHGSAPTDARYAYEILVQPDAKARRQAAKRSPFDIIELSDTLHAALHKPSGTYAFAAFGEASVAQGPLRRLPAGLIVLCRTNSEGILTLSVTDPDLHLPRHGRNVTEEGRACPRDIVLRGSWSLAEATPGASVTPVGDADSRLHVNCRLGLPVEVKLRRAPR